MLSWEWKVRNWYCFYKFWCNWAYP